MRCQRQCQSFLWLHETLSTAATTYCSLLLCTVSQLAKKGLIPNDVAKNKNKFDHSLNIYLGAGQLMVSVFTGQTGLKKTHILYFSLGLEYLYRDGRKNGTVTVAVWS